MCVSYGTLIFHSAELVKFGMCFIYTFACFVPKQVNVSIFAHFVDTLH